MPKKDHDFTHTKDIHYIHTRNRSPRRTYVQHMYRPFGNACHTPYLTHADARTCAHMRHIWGTSSEHLSVPRGTSFALPYYSPHLWLIIPYLRRTLNSTTGRCALGHTTLLPPPPHPPLSSWSHHPSCAHQTFMQILVMHGFFTSERRVELAQRHRVCRRRLLCM